ncbi:hypothetical protein [Sporosarcina limicola]|uniref:Uncharacterized protein n=1 Tax=Sporosarcina limicola TaxID=34101 RepID=A0A927MPM5_9BACL|nr:hypothetical protein [Sporosarcina limicola]MBE1555234.1 hypothetical protein [Sporosarcina limicola]
MGVGLLCGLGGWVITALSVVITALSVVITALKHFITALARVITALEHFITASPFCYIFHHVIQPNKVLTIYLN